MGKITKQAASAVGIVTFAVLASCATFAILSATQKGEARAAVPRYGNVFQSGALAGWATGARISAADSSLVEFDQIAHARQLLQQDAFEYSGLKMRIVQVAQVDYSPSTDGVALSARPRPDKTLVRVTARIERAP